VELVGAIGLAARLLPIVALVGGHLVVGVGAALGLGAMLSAAENGAPADLGVVTLVERILGLRGYVAAWMSWRGHIKASRAN
jgi:hypothetical protein